jgi:hypothetical protein
VLKPDAVGTLPPLNGAIVHCHVQPAALPLGNPQQALTAINQYLQQKTQRHPRLGICRHLSLALGGVKGSRAGFERLVVLQPGRYQTTRKSLSWPEH